MIERQLDQVIRSKFHKGKIVLILGPRQVGKTTLLRALTANVNPLWLNGDESDVRELFRLTTSASLKNLVGNRKTVVIDEAQRLDNIGLSLKLMVDSMPDVQFLVSGSSALELSDSIKEPLTGRKYLYHLYPFSWEELANNTSALEERRLLEQRLIYGNYPDVVNRPDESREILQTLTDSYLYKDLFALGAIKKPLVLDKLVTALALQTGSEVSYHELAQITGSDKETVERYIDLLEKAFVVFRLPSLSRNMRNELKKSRKIYFLDNGIRNSIIKNFNPLNLRQDVGALWENFLIAERLKRNHYHRIYCNTFFWRTTAQQEIDYVEEKDGRIHGYEFKWTNSRPRIPKSFLEAYPGSSLEIINRENFEMFVTATPRSNPL